MATAETTGIYEVLDRVDGGLRLQVEFQPRVNASLISSGIPFIRAVVVHNETGAELSGLRVDLQLTLVGGAATDLKLTMPGPIGIGSVTRIDDETSFAPFVPVVSGAREATPATLDLRARIDDDLDPGATGSGPRILASIEVSAVNEFLNYPGLQAAIATFVQPNTPTVTSVLRAASDLLLKRTGDGSLAGYQQGPERAGRIAGALYEAIRGAEVTYLNPPASFENTGQKIRTTEQVLADRFGTCIDLAVMFAACLEASGLSPLVFITRGHAFPGYYTSETYGDTASVENVNALTNLVELGRIQAIEMTGVGPGKNTLDFRAAKKAADDQFRAGFFTLRTMVDVTRARMDGIRPLPAFGQVALTDEALAALSADRPFVARSSLRNLDVAVEEEHLRGVLDSRDDSPARFKSWKRDLLDLSLRNPLLNMPHTSRVLDLLVPTGMLSDVDDVIHSGKSIRLASGIDTAGLRDMGGARLANEMIDPASLARSFAAGRILHSQRDDLKHRAQLRAMKREAETLEQETGSNYLYLTLGTLVHEKPNGGEARAPLFLLPVKLSGGLAVTPFSISLDGDDVAQPNLCLLEWLKTIKGLDLTELENPALDDSGIATKTVFSQIRQRLVDAELPYRIDETVSVAILRFSTFQVWKDLDENWRSLLEKPVVRHLVEKPGETFQDPAGADAPLLDERSLRLPIAADGTQMAAIARAVSGQSFVLEGPPGTGKSQTITNLIVHALQQGKKVLFVAEKQAALEVVKRRLDAVGVGRFALELHGAKQSMRSIRDQLKASLSLTASTADDGLVASTYERLRTAIGTLERYPGTVHDRNAAGHSLWSAYDALSSLDDGPIAAIGLDWVANDDSSTATVTELVREFAEVAQRFGLRPEHPWTIVGATDPARLDRGAVTTGLAELRAVRPRVEQLSHPWREGIAGARPGGDLEVVVSLLDAQAARILPSEGHLVYIGRPSFAEATTALRAAVTAFRAKHAQILADAPGALELPDLDARITASKALDDTWFFPETRRKKLIAEVQPLVRDGASIQGSTFTPFLQAARQAAAEATPLLAQARAVNGLLLPESWMPHRPGALDELDRVLAAASAFVGLSESAPAAARAIGSTTVSDAEALRDLAAGWRRWLDSVGAERSTVAEWSRDRDWIAAWDHDVVEWQRDFDTTGLLQPERFTQVRRLVDGISTAGLPVFADQLVTAAVPAGKAGEALLRGLASASLDERLAAGSLDRFDSDDHDRLAANYLDASALTRKLLTTASAKDLLAKRPFRADALRGEVAELGRQIDRKRGGLSFRELTRRYPDALQSITPCFLMSPGSVAHYLDPAALEFDLVVFDEASQIRVSQAIGAMGRGRAVVVVGDSRQMPPTRVMQVEASADRPEEGEELVVEDLESILTEAVESGLPQLWLGWHYRSQDESLIAFSNSRYYDGRLVTLPSPGDDPRAGVSWRRVEGTFDRGRTRTNEVEARAIVDEIAQRLRDPSSRGESIGVVCFNIQQRDLILNMLEDSGDLLIEQALTAAPGQDLFVKNLENVQGDERDTILFSLAFSIDPNTGVLPLNFGPLNLAGGERRLNVAITRAKKQIILFSSFDPSDIDLRRSGAVGIKDLRAYLEFAATRAPLGTGPADESMSNRGALVDELAAALRAAGYVVETDLGMSAFKVDLAVRAATSPTAPSPTATWDLAVMVDGPGWSSRPTVADRDASPELLRTLMHWPAVARVWLPGWMRDRDATVARLIEVLENPAAPVDVSGSSASAPGAPSAVPSADQVPAPLVPPPAVPPPARPADGVPVRMASAAAPVSSGASLQVTPFTPAPDTAIATQSVLNNMRMATPAVVRMAGEILDAEGPTSLPRLAATLGRRFGYSRMGDAKKADLITIVTASFHVIDGFAWPVTLSPDTWRGVRTVRSSDQRTITEVSPAEIANAAELIVREALSLTRDDLLREVTTLLGYARLTQQASTWIGGGVDAAVAAGRLVVGGGRVRLGGSGQP